MAYTEPEVKDIIESGRILFAAEALIRHGHNLDVPEEGIRRRFGRGWQLIYQWPLILLVAHGKLIPDGDEDWTNVLAHCAMQYAAMVEVMEMFGVRLFSGVSSKNKFALREFHLELPHEARRAAFTHDWAKRRDIKPGDFTPEEITAGNEMYEDITGEGTKTLVAATGPDFLLRVLRGDASIWELVQFYVDDICRGAKIVPLMERIAEVEARRGDLNENIELSARLGGRKYWDMERETAAFAERALFFTLGGRKNLGISSPEELPSWIRRQIEERIRESMK